MNIKEAPDPDIALLAAVQQTGDRRAFDKLYLRHWERLYREAMQRTGDEAAAKDIVQEVFINIWQRKDEISIQKTFAHYLSGALKYRLIDHFTSAKVKRGVFEKVLLRMNELTHGIDDLAAYREIELALEQELAEMPVNMREAFILRLDELSVREIAQRLNLAEQTVSNNLTAATKRLRASLGHKFSANQTEAMLFLVVINHFLTKG